MTLNSISENFTLTQDTQLPGKIAIILTL